jgi:hypothetical protein
MDSSNAKPPQECHMTGDEDPNRKDDHLTKCAALCLVETGIEVTACDGIINIDLGAGLGVTLMDTDLTPFQAWLLSDALLEVARLAEGTCHEA